MPILISGGHHMYLQFFMLRFPGPRSTFLFIHNWSGALGLYDSRPVMDLELVISIFWIFNGQKSEERDCVWNFKWQSICMFTNQSYLVCNPSVSNHKLNRTESHYSRIISKYSCFVFVGTKKTLQDRKWFASDQIPPWYRSQIKSTSIF